MIMSIDSRGVGPALPRRPVRGLVCLAGMVGAAMLLAMPAMATKPPAVATAKASPKARLSFDTPLSPFQPPVSELSKFSFTASGASAANARLQSVEHAFRFTPSGQSDNRKAFSLGISSRVVAAAVDRSRAAAPAENIAALPTSYDVGLSVNWRGFGVNTAIRHVEPGPMALLAGGRRDAVDLGVSYAGHNWSTMLQGSAERGSTLLFAPLERRYSVELGGAYLLAPRLSVTGGVRYKLAPVAPSLLDADRADQSVYLGTNIAF